MKGVFPSTPITITSRAHGNRTLGGVRVASKAACLHYIDKGFSIQRSSFELRRPEQMMSDLANPQFPISRMSVEDILAFHKAIKDLLFSAKYKEYRISGDNLDTELAIHADSMSEASALGNQIHREALSGLSVSSKDRYGNLDARGLERILPLNASKSSTQRQYAAIKQEIGAYYYADFLDYMPVSKIGTLFGDHSVWKALRALSTNFVFVLNSGVRLYLSMLDSVDVPSATFVEVHRENDAAELFRKRNIEVIVKGSINSTDPFVIVDIAYTGGTAGSAARLIKEIHGQDTKTITVGVFPKTLQAAKAVDYCVYGGRLIATKKLALSTGGWTRELFST